MYITDLKLLFKFQVSFSIMNM